MVHDKGYIDDYKHDSLGMILNLNLSNYGRIMGS